MRPKKLSQTELFIACANTFKRHGYDGTSMSMLAQACGLTKASFYHHYASKELLLIDVLNWSAERTQLTLQQLVEDEKLDFLAKVKKIDKTIKSIFFEDTVGCLMGIIGADVAYSKPELLVPVKDFFKQWSKYMSKIFILLPNVPQKQANALGRAIVADYEGAILLARIHQDQSYVTRVTDRILALAEIPDLLTIYK